MAPSTVPRKRRRFALAGIPLIVGLFASVVATAPWAPAQSGGPDSFGYRFIDSKGAGGPAGGATTIVGNGGANIGNHCDNCVTPLTLPFPVDFYDQAGVTNVNVNSNGVLEFDGNSNDWHVSKLPAAPFGHAALGYWKDLNTENAVAGSNPLSGIYTRTDGVAPNRTFTLEWNAALQGALASAVDFQMVFTEGSADFVNQYIKTPGGTGAAIGIQRQFGPPGKFLQYSDNPASVPNGTAIRWTPGPSLVLGDMAIA